MTCENNSINDIITNIISTTAVFIILSRADYRFPLVYVATSITAQIYTSLKGSKAFKSETLHLDETQQLHSAVK